MRELLQRLYQKCNSICRTVQRSNRVIVAIMCVPIVILFTLLFSCLINYGRHIRNMDCVMEASQIIVEEVPRAVWDIIADKEGSGEAPADLLMSAERLLDSIYQNRSGQVYITSAKEAIDMLYDRIDALDLQIASGASVFSQEQTFSDITGTTAIVEAMIQWYSASEYTVISEINRTVLCSSAVIGVLTLLMLGFILRFSVESTRELLRKIEQPLSELIEAARKISGGDFEIHLEHHDLDELNDLSARLESMAGQLQCLIEEKLRFQEDLKQAEQRILLEQIKPHFLYNTLSTTIWLAEKGDCEKVCQLTRALASFLRISLSQGRTAITVAEEIQHVRAYLEIQAIRYSSILEYTVEIDPAICRYRIEKMLLQPLVENALYHGIKELHGRGRIAVTGRLTDEGSLEFAVSDQGAGIAPERMETLQRMLEEDERPEDLGFGLYNVAKRVRICNQNQNSLWIESSIGQGTTVRFMLPAEEATEIQKEGRPHV